ncbi:MAG: FAD/NAD(P)-binding protein [Bdellovibrionales bacterium]|nr:FAD/NAD(P)-binding protein [Bdellovibrionales bacterium]
MRSKVAIIGAGFSGTMTAVHLLKNTSRPIDIYLIDEHEMGRGLAYKSIDDSLILNVHADQMGAFPEDRDHFYKWLKLKKIEVDPKSFLPRGLYGDYLVEILHEAISNKSSNVDITLIHDTVLEIKELQKEIVFKKTESISFNQIVLATGVQKNMSENVDNLEKYPITILGTGLSMIDVVVLLHKKKFREKIIVASRHGYFPCMHKEFSSDVERPSFEILHSQGLREILKIVRAKMKQYDWRLVIDALRPQTQNIWKALSAKEKSQFLRYLKTIWDVHRHRVSQAHLDLLTTLQENGQLELMKIGFRPYRPKTKNVLDCRGPSLKENDFIQQLVKNKIVTPDRFNLGISSNFDWLHIVGPLNKGFLWETTAVAELRVAAKELASEILIKSS